MCPTWLPTEEWEGGAPSRSLPLSETHSPTPFVSPIWFPLHSRPRLEGRTGGGSERPALQHQSPEEMQEGGGRRQEASRLARSKVPPGQNLGPAHPSALLSGRGGLEWVAWARAGSTFRPGRGPFDSAGGGPERRGGGASHHRKFR